MGARKGGQWLESNERARVRERELLHLGGPSPKACGERLERGHVLTGVLGEESYGLHHVAVPGRSSAVAEEEHPTCHVNRGTRRMTWRSEHLHVLVADLDYLAVLERMRDLRRVTSK